MKDLEQEDFTEEDLSEEDMSEEDLSEEDFYEEEVDCFDLEEEEEFYEEDEDCNIVVPQINLQTWQTNSDLGRGIFSTRESIGYCYSPLLSSRDTD